MALQPIAAIRERVLLTHRERRRSVPISVLVIPLQGTNVLRKAAFALSFILSFFAITAPLAGDAQQLEKVWRIGLLSNSKGGVLLPAPFWDAMRKFGLVEART
jgi:hypothetical protein